jgi:hypothetical protein
VRRAAAVAIACAALVFGTSPSAHGGPVQGAVVTLAPGAFAPPTVVVPRGRPLRLVQLDPVARHDVVSRHVRKGRPLFGRARPRAFGATVLVARVGLLRPGRYPFTCSIHPYMNGTLLVRE